MARSQLAVSTARLPGSIPCAPQTGRSKASPRNAQRTPSVFEPPRLQNLVSDLWPSQAATWGCSSLRAAIGCGLSQRFQLFQESRAPTTIQPPKLPMTRGRAKGARALRSYVDCSYSVPRNTSGGSPRRCDCRGAIGTSARSFARRDMQPEEGKALSVESARRHPTPQRRLRQSRRQLRGLAWVASRHCALSSMGRATIRR